MKEHGKKNNTAIYKNTARKTTQLYKRTRQEKQHSYIKEHGKKNNKANENGLKRGIARK